MPDFSYLTKYSNEYHWMKLHFDKRISEAELTGLRDIRIVEQDTVDGMILKLSAYVLTNHLSPYIYKGKKISITTQPATWWDHFKETYQKSWWLPFKNVKYKTIKTPVDYDVTVEPKLMFPHAKIVTPPDLGKPYMITTVGLE